MKKDMTCNAVPWQLKFGQYALCSRNI